MFEVVHEDTIVASGRVRTVNNGEEVLVASPYSHIPASDYDNLQMTSKDSYTELRLRGYEYEGEFKGIVRASPDGKN